MADGVDLGSAFGRIELDGSQAQQTVDSLASTMRSAGTAMSAAVTLPLVGIGVAAVNSAADFEQSMNIMAQVSGATGDQMATLQAQALEMGAVTSFSAGEAAQAQLELAKAGLDVNEIIAATPGVMDMAAAGGMGLAESAEIAANAMNAFNLPASEMGSVANMLAAAANASSVDIGDLAAAMKMSGAVFASNKQPMDDMVTALAMLGNAGLKGSDAGTSLKTMMLSLAAPTDKAVGSLSDMGVVVYDAQGNMRGFSDILNDLSIATKTMSDEQRNASLSTIFGSDAIRAATILTRDYSKSWDDMSDALGDGSAAANVAGARMKGMNGAVEYLKGSIDSFLIGAALPFLDRLGGIVRVVADGITAFGALPAPVMNAALAFAAVLAAAGPLMLAISGIGTAIAFILSPVGLLVAGVAALAAGFVLWQQNFGGVQERAAALGATLRRMAQNVTGIDFDGLADGLRSFGNYLGAVMEDGDYLNDWLTHLPEPIQPAVQALGQLVAAFGGLMQTGDLGAFGQEMRDMFPGAAAAMDEGIAAISAAVDKVAPIFQGIYDVLIEGKEPLGDWSYWWEQMATVVGEDAATIISGLTEVAQGVARVVAALLVGDMTGVGERLAGLRQSLVAFGQDIASIDWGGIAAGIQAGVVSAIQSIDWAGALETAGGWLDGLKNGVIAAIQGIPWADALTAAGEWLASLRDGVVSAVTSIPWLTYLASAGNFFAGLTQGVVNRLTTINWGAMLAQAGDWLAGLWSNVTAALGRIPWATALATASGWLDTLKANVIAAIQGINWAGALTAGGNAFGTLETAVTGALSALGFSGAATGLEGIKAAFASLPAAINGAKAAFAGLWAQVTPIAAMLAAFFAPALARLQAAFTALPEAMAPLLPKLQALGASFGPLVTALQPFVALIGAGLVIAVDFGVNRLTTVFASLPQLLGPIIDQVTATIRLITTILTEVVGGVKAAIDGDWAAVWEHAKTIAGGFSEFFRGLFSRLGTFMGAVARNIAEPIIKTLQDLGVNVAPILDGVRKAFEDTWAKVTTYIQPVIDIVATLTTKIGEFKDFLSSLNLPNPFAGLASAADAVRNAIGEFGAGVVEGFTGQPATADGKPQASGTSYFPGGLAQINERGYEQIVLPAGARVMTNGQTNNPSSDAARPININLGGVTVNSPMDARLLGNILRDQLIMAGV